MEHLNTFAGSPLNRAGNERRDAQWLQTQADRENSRFLPMWQLRPLMALGETLTISWRSRAEVAPFLDQGASIVFLGLQDDAAHFAVDVSMAGPKKADAPFREEGKWIDVRSAASSAAAPEAAILAQGRSMLDWHARHGFCAVCGSPSTMDEGGYSRKCNDEACAAMHFPRTDPVTIMLVLDDADNCLLGRQKIFAPMSYSALAGFMEPGETIEEAVRREVREEVGIVVGKVRYISSQPWPFPSSLMIGCFGYATDTEINIDEEELEDARWFTRAEIADMANSYQDQTKLRMPAPLAIAHQLAQAWLREG
jgi:NAD+ diphosphatase